MAASILALDRRAQSFLTLPKGSKDKIDSSLFLQNNPSKTILIMLHNELKESNNRFMDPDFFFNTAMIKLEQLQDALLVKIQNQIFMGC